MKDKIDEILNDSELIDMFSYGSLNTDEASKRITAHVFEFIAWLRSGGVMEEDEYDHRYIEESRKTDEELYQYWLTNVKDK